MMFTPRTRAILYYNPSADFDEASGGDCMGLVVRSTAKEREKEIAGRGWGRDGRRGLVWKISTSYKSAVARTENGGKGCRGDADGRGGGDDEGGCRGCQGERGK